MSWHTVPLIDVLEFREGPGILAKDFHDEGIPLIRLAGLKQGASQLEGCNYLDPGLVAKKWSHFQVRLGDVLLSTSASLGEVAEVGPEAVGAVPYTGIIAFRSRSPRVDQSFIRFLLTAPGFKAQVEAMGVGSVMKHFGPSHLKFMTVDVPPVSDQRAIAEVLGALDDKIAANTRLAAKTHDLSSALFRRHLGSTEYSGMSFGELATVGGGGTPSTKEPSYWDGAIPWATPTDVTGLAGPYLEDTTRKITESGLAACASSVYPPGTILMTSRATIGAFAITQVPTSVNQGFIAVQPRDHALTYWFYHEMRERVDEFISMANGATFLELSRGNFKKFDVRLATQEVMRSFCSQAASLHRLARNALQGNRPLAATRDTLLPRLMSGNLRVKDAEKVVAAAVE